MEKDNSYKNLFKSEENKIIPYIAKIEAFKIMFPIQYEKLVRNLAPDINKIISTYHDIIRKEK